MLLYNLFSVRKYSSFCNIICFLRFMAGFYKAGSGSGSLKWNWSRFKSGSETLVLMNRGGVRSGISTWRSRSTSGTRRAPSSWSWRGWTTGCSSTRSTDTPRQHNNLLPAIIQLYCTYKNFQNLIATCHSLTHSGLFLSYVIQNKGYRTFFV